MKVINSQPPIPFTERKFTVEMTGAELAVIKALTGICSGCSDTTVKHITSQLYMDNPVEDFVGFNAVVTFHDQAIDLTNESLSDFLKKVNLLNK